MSSLKNDLDKPNEQLNLFNLIINFEIYPKWIGLSIESKFEKWSFFGRIFNIINLFILWSFFILWINILPIKEEKWLLYGGDLFFLIMDKTRRLGSPLEFTLVSTCIVMWLFYYIDDYSWLLAANVQVERLKLVKFRKRIHLYILKAKIMLIVIPIIIGSVIFFITTVSFFINFKRNSKYNLGLIILSSINLSIFHLLCLVLISQFLARVYFLIKFTSDCYRQLNEWAKEQISDGNKNFEDIFNEFYADFSVISLMFNQFRGFVKKYFLILFCGEMPICIFLFYIMVYRTDQSIYIRILIGFVFPAFTLGLISIAWQIGRITGIAQEIEPVWYKNILINTNSGHIFDMYFVDKISRYLQILWCESIGIDIIGFKINTNSAISILTIFLTLLAMSVSNINNLID